MPELLLLWWQWASRVCLKAIKGLFGEQLSNIKVGYLAFIKTSLFNVVGGFANNNYWSSSEYNANNAWNQNFNNGNQNNNNKNNTNYVRAVRGFKQKERNAASVWKKLAAFAYIKLFTLQCNSHYLISRRKQESRELNFQNYSKHILVAEVLNEILSMHLLLR